MQGEKKGANKAMQAASRIYTAASVAVVCAVLLYGCGGGGGRGNPTEVLITPGSAQVIDGGDSIQLSATVRYADGSTEDVTAQVTWQWTGDAAVGSISNAGLFTAGAECGQGTVVVSYNGLQDSMAFTVRLLTGLTVTPAGGMDLCAGATQQFTATATWCGNADGQAVPEQATTEDVTDEADWSWTGAAGTGSVDTGGTFTAGETEGQGRVRASYGGMSADSGMITVINSGDVPINISQLEGGNS